MDFIIVNMDFLNSHIIFDCFSSVLYASLSYNADTYGSFAAAFYYVICKS